MPPPTPPSPRLIVGAAQRADLRSLRYLKANGADLNASWRGYRPLHALIQEKPHAPAAGVDAPRRRCLEWLLANGADPEQTGAWPPARAILVAAFTGEAEFVDLLRGAEAKFDGFVAAALGDSRAVRAFLRREPGLALARDVGGLTALQCCAGSRLGTDAPATARGLLRVAEALLDAGADPNAHTRAWGDDVDVAYFACSAHHGAMLTLLLDRGADATAALPSAAWRPDDGLAEILLRYGPALDEARSGGRPLLNDLVRWGQVASALWLLSKGAGPNVPDERGWTAVHQACSRGNVRMVEALLEAGGDLGAGDASGCTPLEVARAMGRARIVQWIDGRGRRGVREQPAPGPGRRGGRALPTSRQSQRRSRR